MGCGGELVVMLRGGGEPGRLHQELHQERVKNDMNYICAIFYIIVRQTS